MDLPLKQRGDTISAHEWNALVTRAHWEQPLPFIEDPRCYNADADVAPVYAVMAVTGVHGTLPEVLPQVEQPSSTPAKDYLVNGESTIKASRSGIYQNDGEIVKIAYDTGTPAVDEIWVPKAGQWTLTKGSDTSGWHVVVTGIHNATKKILLGRVVRAGSSLTPLILYDDVAPDDTGKQGMPVKSDGTADTSADKVTINNKHPGNFRGYGSSHSGFDATTAAKVWCAKDNNGDWQIVSGKGLAKRCKAKAKGVISGSGSTGTVDNVTACDDGQCPTASTSDELSINNPWNYYLADNADCELTQSGSSYDITNVVRVSETFDTENQVTGLTLQHKYREIRVNPTGDEHDWETWHTGDDCEA